MISLLRSIFFGQRGSDAWSGACWLAMSHFSAPQQDFGGVVMPRRRREDEGAKREITDELVVRICAGVRDGLTIRQACAREGVHYKSFSNAYTGEHPRRPDWRRQIDAAKAEEVAFWYGELKRGGDEKNTALVTASKAALEALHPDFSRKDHGQGPPIQIQIVQGEGPRTRSVDVVMDGVVGGGGSLPPGLMSELEGGDDE